MEVGPGRDDCEDEERDQGPPALRDRADALADRELPPLNCPPFLEL